MTASLHSASRVPGRVVEPRHGTPVSARRHPTGRPGFGRDAFLADAGVRFSLGIVAVVFAALGLALTPAPVWLLTAGLALVAASVGRGLAVPWQAALALVAWACVTGFAVNHFGELTFAVDDVVRLAVLVFGVPPLAALLGLWRGAPE